MQPQRTDSGDPATPIRKRRPLSSVSFQEPSPSPAVREMADAGRDFVPSIQSGDDIATIIRKLSDFFLEAIDVPYTYEQLRTSQVALKINPLVSYLARDCHHPAIVIGLLGLRYHLARQTADDRGLSEARGLACEIVAWRFAANLSERELIDYLLFELPEAPDTPSPSQDEESNGITRNGRVRDPDETTSLLSTPKPLERQRLLHARSISHMGSTGTGSMADDFLDGDIVAPFWGLNALEIAVIADAKKFLSQRTVQHVLNGIWNGSIVFWNSLNVNSVKKAHIYNDRQTDPYCRLRVPKYQKAFEALFFMVFLGLYYYVLVAPNTFQVDFLEVLLYIWIAAFAYDEFGEFLDAGSLFYAADFWSMWDIGIIGIGIAFFATRIVGLTRGNRELIDTSFDILSLAALFLVPRIFAIMSLNPYVGTLIPCLKEMTKDFLKFLCIVVILYLGFLTTFTLLARDNFTLSQMSWMLIKVFFGYLGFDAMEKINPVLGPPLMLIFVCMTNILLITSLISLLSNSLTKVMDHAREEYQFIYAVFVLEASTSNRLTYFIPPLNLIPLVLVRPLRLFLPASQARTCRIFLLKITHFPFVLAIWAYEAVTSRIWGPAESRFSTLGPAANATSSSAAASGIARRSRLAANSVVSLAADGSSLHAQQPGPAPAAGPLPVVASEELLRGGAGAIADILQQLEKLAAKVDDLSTAIAEMKDERLSQSPSA